MRNDDFAKLDRNFIENPLFLQASDMKVEEGLYCWESDTGYRYECDNGKLLPTAVDYKILMHILAIAQHNNERRVEFHGSEILEPCRMQDGGKQYDRLENSLLRWQSVKLRFDRDVCPLKGFPEVTDIRILEDGGRIPGSKQFYATLSEDWFRINCCSKWWERVPLKAVGHLRNDLPMRLHALVSHYLAGRQQWSVDALDLARLIPLRPEDHFACRVAQRIPEALKSITAVCNECGKKFGVRLETKNYGRGRTVLKFLRKVPLSKVTVNETEIKAVAEKNFPRAEAATLLDCLKDSLHKNNVFMDRLAELLEAYAESQDSQEMLIDSLDCFLVASAKADDEMDLREKSRRFDRKKARLFAKLKRTDLAGF